jgi:hypothetical protein
MTSAAASSASPSAPVLRRTAAVGRDGGASRQYAIRWLHALEQATAPVHSTVPYLQLISMDLQLDDGLVYRMFSKLDDGSGSGYW